MKHSIYGLLLSCGFVLNTISVAAEFEYYSDYPIVTEDTATAIANYVENESPLAMENFDYTYSTQSGPTYNTIQGNSIYVDIQNSTTQISLSVEESYDGWDEATQKILISNEPSFKIGVYLTTSTSIQYDLRGTAKTADVYMAHYMGQGSNPPTAGVWEGEDCFYVNMTVYETNNPNGATDNYIFKFTPDYKMISFDSGNEMQFADAVDEQLIPWLTNNYNWFMNMLDGIFETGAQVWNIIEEADGWEPINA